MFIDKAKIRVKSGKGGDGKVSFRREKYVPDGGPDGGDGGKGGDIIFRVDTNMRTLMDFKYKRKYEAKDGENGKAKKMFGKDADDLIIRVPPGTIIRDFETNKVMVDLSNRKEDYVLFRGGRGGRGNTHFKTSTRQAPQFAKPGAKGYEREIVLELKVLADVGLVGFPNVGKSTILSIVSKATPKISNYHFTTLKPNLGVVEAIKGESFVLADIPGLIEDASDGVGLGFEFLRHIERTRLLIHVVDISASEGRNPIEDYKIINNELNKYNKKISNKKQIVVGNKSDIMEEDSPILDEFKKIVEADGHKFFLVSAISNKNVNELMKYTTKVLRDIEDEELFEVDELFSLDDIEEDDIRYEIVDDVYEVKGKRIDYLLYCINLDNSESLRFMHNTLIKMGVFDVLESMGITDGDTVRVSSFEFEYYR